MPGCKDERSSLFGLLDEGDQRSVGFYWSALVH